MIIPPLCSEPEQLLTSLREGKEDSYAYVFRTYYAALFNYAGRIIRDEAQAHDIVQETFCHLYENRQTITIHFSLKSYLYKSVYNYCMDLIRHQKVVEGYINAEMLDVYFSKVIQLPEAELALMDKDLSEAIQDAVNRLPERCREIFRLSKFEGLSNKQIAELLDISVKTVEAQMTTAFTRLRKDLEWLLFIIFSINS